MSVNMMSCCFIVSYWLCSICCIYQPVPYVLGVLKMILDVAASCRPVMEEFIFEVCLSAKAKQPPSAYLNKPF